MGDTIIIKILKMKIFMALTALVAGTSIVSSDTKAGCACCFGSISCCAICCVTKCRDDSVLTGKVANLLDEVQMGLSEAQTESCGKCALCYLNGENCNECGLAQMDVLPSLTKI